MPVNPTSETLYRGGNAHSIGACGRPAVRRRAMDDVDTGKRLARHVRGKGNPDRILGMRQKDEQEAAKRCSRGTQRGGKEKQALSQLI